MNIPYFIPWITQSDKNAVKRAMSQRWLTNGPILKQFEEKIQTYTNTKYAIGVGSATHALHLAVRSLGICHGDEVIVPTFTFAATANAASYTGAKPILADVDEKSFNITPKEIKKRITKKTKAVIVVHYGGQACDIDEIQKICNKLNLFLIEDCAHALGSKFYNKKCGSIGDIGCFSFYPTKIITTGEGGMVTTQNKALADKIRILRSHAVNVDSYKREKLAAWKYDIIDLGYNYRLDELRSALGLSQLSRINKINKMRQNIAKIYDKHLSKIRGISIPEISYRRNHIYHLYTIKVERDYHSTRDELYTKLQKNGVGTSVQYWPLHLMTYNKNKYDTQSFPNANSLKEKVLSLPIFPKMTMKQIDFVVSLIK